MEDKIAMGNTAPENDIELWITKEEHQEEIIKITPEKKIFVRGVETTDPKTIGEAFIYFMNEFYSEQLEDVDEKDRQI